MASQQNSLGDALKHDLTHRCIMLADLLCMVGFFVTVFLIFSSRFKRFRANHYLALEALAKHHGFGFNPNHAWNATVMNGMIGKHRCDVSFETVRRRSRRNRSSTYLHVTVSLNVPSQLGLHITPQGFLTEGLRLPDSFTGNQDIIIGDQAFDEKYRIKGFDENAVRAHLTPKRVHAVLQVQQSLGPLQHVSLTDQQVSVRFPGLITNMQLISDTAKLLVWLAEQFEA